MLILFPCSLHVVNALNYAMFTPGNGNFELRWSYNNNKLIFSMTCKATGWCAVAFTETATGRGMVDYDIVAGGVASNTPYLAVSLGTNINILTVLFSCKVAHDKTCCFTSFVEQKKNILRY